ncbi:hypothetical protein MBLNU459_g0137t1 [Dothideomycetes sp. NU459]
MSHNILITGGSGYLGGSLLARWKDAELPAYQKLFALVRTQQQAEAVKRYGAQPLDFNVKDERAVTKAIIDNKITVIYYLIGVVDSEVQVNMIKALAQVKKQLGHDVHFLQTSGAKICSNHAGFPTNGPILDTDTRLYDFHRIAQAPHLIMEKAAKTNTVITDTAEANDVKSYIFFPCIVYGKGEGFGNQISIQTVAIVRAARKLRSFWPVCHVIDNSTLYLEIMRHILAGESIGHGKNGYYLASSGSVAWEDIYSAMAQSLANRKVITSAGVDEADDAVLQRMGDALGCPKELVPVQLGGRCDLKAEHGKSLGWKPRYAPEHILQSADVEVELILENLKE